ncbi:hypothetical protein D3C81_774580 [compost metagenome]
MSGNGRRYEQSGGQPSRGDPEDAELRVPCSRHRVRDPVCYRNAVEAAPLYLVVSRDRSQCRLDHHQRGDHPEVFQGRFH